MSARPACSSPPGTRRWLLALGLAPLVCAAQSAATPPDSLAACAALGSDAERLACYDRVAGHTAPAAKPAAPPQSGPVPASAAVAPAAPAPVPAIPAPAPAAAAATAAPPAVPSAPAAVAAPATPPAAPAGQSFGLYQAEHPKVAVSDSLEARVTSLGKSKTGHMTVALEGGGLWELDDDDPLLAAGDTVVITRATLGSYLMRTSSKRFHRVRRLQ